MEEDKKLKKYWDLEAKGFISKDYSEELLALYEKYEDPRNKCTVAIFLGLIKDDERVVPRLFDALDYWDDSGYGGWVVTTTARLFNNYVKARKQYVEIMNNGTKKQRAILSSALFFFQEPLKNITKKELDHIIDNYIKTEPEKELRDHIKNHRLLQKEGINNFEKK